MLYQKYQVAHSLQEAMNWLDNKDGRQVRLIAGGTDLILQLHERILSADVLIDVSCVPELRRVRLEAGRLVIGATTPYVEIIRSPLVHQHAFLLVEASKQIGAAQIQNTATLGGNIGNASPAADAIPCLYALEAEVVVQSLTGERVIPIADFHQGYRKLDLRSNELIAEVRFPKPLVGSGTAFIKYALRKSQAISVVNVAVVLHLNQGKIDRAALALGAVGPTIIRSPSAEQILKGQPPSEALFEAAGEAARRDANPIDDLRGSASFRRYLVGVCVVRALRTAMNCISIQNRSS
jgi:carbon-monoxide dehydrogenase medium subunit